MTSACIVAVRSAAVSAKAAGWLAAHARFARICAIPH
jgi:hypothetical protein